MNFAAFFTYVAIATYTPGPNNIMSMTNAVRHGFAKALGFCFGVFLGFIVDMSLCALATSFLFDRLPAVEPALRWIGAAYIAWLAFAVYRDKGGERGEKAALAPDGLLAGVVLQLVNVKVILYGITAFSTFILPHYRTPGALALFVLLLSAIGLSSNLCWAGFGSLFRKFHAAHRRPLNAVMALLLLYCAAGIVWNG